MNKKNKYFDESMCCKFLKFKTFLQLGNSKISHPQTNYFLKKKNNVVGVLKMTHVWNLVSKVVDFFKECFFLE